MSELDNGKCRECQYFSYPSPSQGWKSFGFCHFDQVANGTQITLPDQTPREALVYMGEEKLLEKFVESGKTCFEPKDQI